MSARGFPGSLAGSLLHARSWPVDTEFGRFDAHEFRNLSSGGWAIAMTCGAIDRVAPLLARVHSSCVTSETFGGCDCDCAQQLWGAMAAISAEGRGVVFYLMQEGRGAGLVAKARDRMLVQASRHRLTTFEAYERLGLPPDGRRYGEVAAICRLLEIEAPLRLLTNNPDKVVALEREKIQIESTQPLSHSPSAFNRHYLKAKRGYGHFLSDPGPGLAIAQPPVSVEWLEPSLVPGSSVVQLASYFLPVRVEGRAEPLWFLLSLYWDPRSKTERVVLELAARKAAEVPIRIQSQVVIDRFPLLRPSYRRTWVSALQRFADAGAGLAVFLPSRLSGAGAEPIDEVTRILAAKHLEGRSGRLLLTQEESSSALSDGVPGVSPDPTRLDSEAGSR